ncbi:hypothetical protein IPM19_00085 [bacterium]|nr:MAG: hypothetical protein IPM19_00085 [bacterium]
MGIITQKKVLLFTAGLMLAFCFAIKFFPPLELLVHELVNLFASGRSIAKIFGFFLYTAMLCLLLIQPLRPKFEYLKTLTGVILATYGYGLLVHIILIKNLGLKLTDFVIIFNNQELSTTTIKHIHVLKGIIAAALQWLGVGVLENVDGGLAYIGLIHPIILVVGLFLVGTSFSGMVLLFLHKYKELFKNQTPGRWQVLYVLLFSIVSFSLVKNFIDGGILNRETPFALAALLFIMFPIDPTRYTKRGILWRLSPVLGYFVIVSLINLSQGLPWSEQWALIFQGLTLGALLGSMLYYLAIRKVNRGGILLIIMCALLLYWPVSHAKNMYRTANKPISEGPAYVGVLKEVRSEHYELIEQIEDLKIYEYKTEEPFTVQQLIDKNNLLDNIGPVKVPWYNCLPMNEYKESTFDLLTVQPIKDRVANSRFIDLAFNEQGMVKDWHSYKVRMAMRPCGPRPLNIIERLIQKSGAQTFFISNIQDEQ